MIQKITATTGEVVEADFVTATEAELATLSEDNCELLTIMADPVSYVPVGYLRTNDGRFFKAEYRMAQPE